MGVALGGKVIGLSRALLFISQASWHRQSEQGEGVHTFEPLQTPEWPDTAGETTQVISQEFF